MNSELVLRLGQLRPAPVARACTSHTLPRVVCVPCQQSRCRPHATASASSDRSTLSSSILSVLKDEQKYAAGDYRKDEELLDDPPNDFEIDSPPGKRAVYLLKEHKDEQLIVQIDLEEQVDADGEDDEDEGEDDDEDEELPPVSFSVQVVKQKGILSFECVSDGEYVTIKSLALLPASSGGGTGKDSDRDSDDDDNDDTDDDDDDEDDDDVPYTGPDFEKLDDTLQQAFLDFLEERGITADLGRYLQKLLTDKSATEYQAWLQRVRDFISG